MPVLSFVEAKPILTPIVDIAVDTLLESHVELQDFLNLRPEMLDKLDSSTQASMLSNIFARNVRPRFAIAALAWAQAGRIQHGTLANTIELRFKKLTTDLHSMNVPTEAQTKLYHQWPLPGVPERTNVTFGYLFDPIARQIAAAFFICPKSFNANHWSWAVYGGDSGGVGLFGVNEPINPVEDPSLDVGISIAASAIAEGA